MSIAEHGASGGAGAARLPHGWIILDKPVGLGSTQAVAAVKRNLREAGFIGPRSKGAPKLKVGHGGTLDPLASGVLPIAVGEATKLTGRMLDARKRYVFTIAFGEETDTLDAGGKIIARSSRLPPLAAIPAILEHFTGEQEQVPPAFSALKIGGERAYAKARKGEAVIIAPRKITVYSLALASAYEPDDTPRSAFAQTAGRPDPFDPSAPLELAESVTLVADVSKGTYIRSLARDIAHALGTHGHVTMLRRTKCGPFDLDEAISLDKLNELGQGAPLEQIMLPLETGLVDIPAIDLTPAEADAVRKGRALTGMPQPSGHYWTRFGSEPVALIQVRDGETHIARGFHFHDVAE